MRSNKGESNFMTEHYAKAASLPSSILTDAFFASAHDPYRMPNAVQDQVRASRFGALRRRRRCAGLTLANRSTRQAAMQVKALIAEKLAAALSPQSLEVVDESHRHEGHSGHRPGGQTHFRVSIVAEAFRGKNRLERHRMVNQILASELAAGVHALAIHASAPGEANS
jgi:BolA protein